MMKCMYCGHDELVDFGFGGKRFCACELCGNFWTITDVREPFRHQTFMKDYPYCNLISVRTDDIYGGGYPTLEEMKVHVPEIYWDMMACIKVIDLWLVNQDLSKHKFPTWVLKLLDDGWEADYPMLAKLQNAERGE